MRRSLLLLSLLSLAPSASGYSVLSHEALVDAAWTARIVPILLLRFPNATPEQLQQAHGYAYGGCIIQDMGYYPFGSRFFSDLTHYVRSGTFILNLLSEAQDLDEYAFALGALAHYSADNIGHSVATNRSVALLYPKLKLKFGDTVTYEDAPAAHLATEFSFDVIQVAQGRYASKAYHDFIGFAVSKPVLERAFLKTYGLELKNVFASLDLALGTYRRTVSSLIPNMTKVAWQLKKGDIGKATPGATRRKFVYNLSRSSYEKEWGHDYEKPGAGTRILAFFVGLLPKVGPLHAFAFHNPSPQVEALFMRSFNDSLDKYRQNLDYIRSGKLPLPDENFDTGLPAKAGAYRKADEAYWELIDELSEDHFARIDPDLRAALLQYYANATTASPPSPEKNLRQLRELRDLNPLAPDGKTAAH